MRLLKNARKIRENSDFYYGSWTDKTDQTHYSCIHFVLSGSRFDDNKATAFEPQKVRILNFAHS